MRFGPSVSFWIAGAVIVVGNWGTASPSVIYPQWAHEWQLTEIVTTTVFATYGATLAVVLILFGGVSDRIGRRGAMLAGLAFLAVGAVLLAVAPAVIWLYIARLAQGVGIGLSLGAASASLVDFNVTDNPARASSVNTLSNSIGLIFAAVIGGAIVRFLPAPTHLTFWFLALGTIAVLILVVFIPRHDGADSLPGARAQGGWRPAPIGVPRGLRRVFLGSALIGFTSLGIGGILLSLGAQIAGSLIGTSDVFVQGLLIGTSSVPFGLVSLVLRSLSPRVAATWGGIAGVVSMGLFIPATVMHSLPIFIASQVVGGLAMGLGMLGGVGFIHRSAPLHQRGQLISAFYLVCYLAQGSVAVFGGLMATSLGLAGAVMVFSPTIAAIALVATIVAATTRTAERPGAAPTAVAES